MPEPLRVLLVDDHAMMRAGFRLILEAADNIEIVGEASTGSEGVAATRRLRPDVVCMDVQMPDMDGLEATRRIVADSELATAVLIVTTFDRDDYLFEALSAGAAGFLLKNAGPEELVRAVRVAAAGDALLSPEVTRRVIARFAAGGGGAAASTPALSVQQSLSAHPRARDPQKVTAEQEMPTAPAVDLTEREAEVLRLMSDALSNAEIARRLYIGEATVKTHVSNVLAKLGARDRVQAVVLAYRHGLA
jgi:DNA-binding NarL/FixJ family response regulator